MIRPRYLILVIAILVLLFVALAFGYTRSFQLKTKSDGQKPLTWEECLTISGSKVLTSDPTVCVVPNGQQVTQQQGEGSGMVEGVVSFVGTPCNPQYPFKVPPCDGPYPNYEVVFYKEDKKTVAAKATTDQNGKYQAALESGTYYILPSEAAFGKTLRPREVKVVVKAQETIQQNIRIDTGIR